MKISEVSASLSGQDILSIINDYVNIENLSIDNVIIDENLRISGSYTKIVKFGFLAEAKVIRVSDNNVYFRLGEVKISKVPIFKGILNTALKHIVRNFEKYGVFINKDELIINVNTLERYIPYVDFTLESLSFSDKFAQVHATNIVISKNKDENVQIVNVQNSDNAPCIINKKHDKYKNLRKNLKKKVPEKYKPLMEYMLIVPDIAALLVRLCKDERVSIKAKAIAGSTAVYLLSPIDIIPDFIPFVGQFDDLSIAFFALNSIIKMIPENIILENWSGNDDIIKKVKEGIKVIDKFMQNGNIKKFFSSVSKLFKHHREDNHEKGDNIH